MRDESTSGGEVVAGAMTAATGGGGGSEGLPAGAEESNGAEGGDWSGRATRRPRQPKHGVNVGGRTATGGNADEAMERAE